MESVDERFNRLKAGIQAREESVTQRYNDIVNRMNTQQQLAQRRAKVNPMNSIRNQYSVFKQRLPEIRKQTEYNKANAKRLQEEQTAKNLGMSYEDFKKAEEQRKAVATNAMKDGKKPNYNLPQLSVSNEEKKDKRDNGQYSLTDLSYDIAYSDWNKTPYGKIARVGIDAINNAGTITDSAVRGADNGGADFLSYATRLTKKKDEMLNNAGTWGKVLAVATGDTEYLFNNDTKREAETREILNSLERLKNNNNEQIDYNRKIVDQNSTTGIVKKVNELAPSIGNNAVGAGLSMISPTAGTMYFIGSAGGSYYDDAIRRGMNEDQALLYGTVMGTMEGLTEKVALGQTTKAGMMLGKGELGKALTETGISLGENFIQEAIMEPIQETSAMVIGGKDKSDFSNMGQRMLQSGIDGALSAILMEGATAGVQSAVNVQDKIERGQNVSDKEIQQALFDVQASKKVDIEAKFKQEIQYQVQKASREYAEKDNIENLQQNSIKNQNINQQQQISQAENKNALNQNLESQSGTKFSKILNNQKLPMQSYVYEKSDNVKIDTLRQQANKYFNNSPEAHNFVDMLEKIIEDKNIAINFNTNLAEDVNGLYNNGVITINPNSSRAGEFLAIHELTHAIGTDSMIKMVDNYRKSNAEFDSQVQKLLEKYNKSEINEEALADIAGQLFGNQEYINNLSKTNPNMFKRIYNEIKYLWHQFRGYKNKEQFVDDLMFKWEQAYRKQNKSNNSSTKYSIQKDSNGKQFIQVDTDQNIFDGINPKDYNKIAKMYIQDYLLGKTTLSENDTASIENKSASKYTNPGQTQYFFDEKMKLTPELKNVLQIAEKVSNSKPNKPNSKYSNWEYYKFRFSLDGNNFEGLVNIGIDKAGNKHFYEINNIKKTSILGTSLNNRTGLSNNSIAPSNENVNTAKYSMQESENNSGSFNLPKTHKQQQLEIILESNPMQDDYHTGIRELEDIKTLSETLQDKEWADYDEFNPDLSRKDIEDAIKTGKVTVYSSYPIEQGTFISPSKMEAESYSGDGKIYSKEVYINDVAWIDPTQGQYAKINESNISSLPKTDNKGNMLSKQQQEYFKDSKVRDENGKLLEVYHGTEANAGIPKEHWFTTFDLDHARPSTLGDGFYFTEDYERASSYAHSKGNVYKVYLNITNPFIKGINQTFREAVEEINPNYDIRNLYGNEHESSRFDGNKLRKYLIDNGYDGISLQGTYVAFYPEQIKNVDNQNPTSNSDIRYSKNSSTWQEYLEKEFPAKGTRTNMQDIKQGTNLPTGKNVNTKQEYKTDTSSKVSANNKYKDTTTKVRKHYKSIIESANTTPEAKAIAKKLMGTDTYIPETNKSELERADEKIMNSTPESELNSLMSRATIGEKITPVDIAVGERLIEYYSKIGDKAKLQDAIQATAMAGTTAGQTVQAMSLLNHMTPQGQAVWLQRSVDKMNNKLKKTRGKNAQQFTLTDDMLQKIVSSENEEQLTKNLDEVYKELGQQVSKSTMEKIDAWRYFSMLANPRTHIRNILGNFAMARVQVLKNKVAGVTEAVVSKANKNMERTHTIVPASKEVRQFAKADIKNVTDRLGLTEGKLNPQTRLENNMKTFKHDAMNKTVGKLFDLNNKALEVEDGWGLKAGYAKALAEYMTANKLKPDTITDAQLSKARNYAVQQAKEATFHQENQLASLVNQLSNRNRFAKFGVDAVLPFKKTPMNIAKTGIEYSPVGLAKSMVLDTVQLRKGNITVNQYIDNISKGLTGTGITLVGYALAQAGILKASGGDDDKEKYEEGRGKQAFSIQIGDNTYSLDWLAPTAIPLFIGAEISALNRATNETKTSNSSDEDSKYNQLLKSTTNVLDAFTNSMNPMMEMSMLSGLASTLRSYEQGATQGITAMGTNALKSYVNQFFPTAMGQVAKTMDPYERSTTSTKSGMLPKAVDSTKNQIMAKVPGLRQMLPTKTDVWGNDMKQPNNVVQRTLENAVLPYTRKEVNNNDVDQELVRLYEERGEKAVLPSSSLSKDLTFTGEKYKMTSEEFAKYKKDYGSKSYNLINDLVNSSDYNRLSDEDKQQALENVYKYAKEYAKDQYAKANDIDYKKDTMFKTAQELEKSGNISSYFNYLAKTDGMKEKEKMNVLVKASYDNNDKKLIYSNTIGSDDKLYNDAMKYTGININEYLKYKQQEFTSDKTDDGTENGKSVSGSKKAKVYDYVNKMKITGEQRMLLLGTQYKLTNAERATLANYVKNLKITKNEKLQIYKKLQGFTVYKDGRVTY